MAKKVNKGLAPPKGKKGMINPIPGNPVRGKPGSNQVDPIPNDDDPQDLPPLKPK
jgi:hypothetical protein